MVRGKGAIRRGAKVIQAIERIRHNGETYEPGEKINKITEKEAQRLVDLGVAFFIGENYEVEAADKPEEVEPVEDQGINIEEELESIDYSDLKELAKEVGLEFAGNISKKNLIALIIEENKAEDILNLTEVEE